MSSISSKVSLRSMQIQKILQEGMERRRLREEEKMKLDLANLEKDITPILEDNYSQKDFPVSKYCKEILKSIQQNVITIISSPTGTGKTTQVPQMIYRDAIAKNDNVQIIVSQPRKLAAITNAQRVAAEMNSEVGDLVGYHVGLDNKTNQVQGNSTKITFATTGVLLEKLISAKDANSFTHFILDEVHEREVDMDLVLAIIREFLHRNSNAKVIIMSATLQVDSFVKYFIVPCVDNPISPGIIKIENKLNFKVKTEYLKDEGSQYNCLRPQPIVTDEIIDIAVKIIKKSLSESEDASKTILVFLPGMYEIERMKERLESRDDIKNSCLIAMLHSSISTAYQQLAFRRSDKRKVILSTNIAESSVTIPNVNCIIDFCLTKYLVVDDITKFAKLKMDWASRDNLEQRAGRTGRTCEGTIYRLITKSFYDKLRPHVIPEMLRAPLENVVLKVKKLNIFTAETMILKCPSSPKVEAIKSAVLTLKELGGLFRKEAPDSFNCTDGNLTRIGQIMSALPLDVRFSKFIVLGYMFSILDEAIVIAAGLSVRGLFVRRIDDSIKSYENHLKWADESACDFVAILNAYYTWLNKKEQGDFQNDWKKEREWCRVSNLEIRSLNEMRRLIEEIKNRWEAFDFSPLEEKVWEDNMKPFIIKIVACGSFIPNYFISGITNEEIEKEKVMEIYSLPPERTIYFQKLERKYIPDLYVDHIKKMLINAKIAQNPEDMRVVFASHADKFYVEFISDAAKIDDRNQNVTLSPNMPGDIPLEMYRAAHAKKSNCNFNLKVMDHGDAIELLESNGLRDYGMYFDVIKNYMKYPELCAIPAPCETFVHGMISHIDHPEKFFVQRIDGALEKIQTMLRNIDDFQKCSVIGEIEIGDLVIAKISGQLFRAKVIKTFPTTRDVLVRLVDYGAREEVPFNDVFKCQETQQFSEIFDISERCFEARLSHVAPSYIKCQRGRWTLEAIQEFSNLILYEKVKVEIFSVENDIAAVKIENVAEKLIDLGFATSVDESFNSKLLHNARINAPGDASEEFLRRISTLKEIKLPEVGKDICTEFVKLKGPFTVIDTQSLDQIFKTYKTTTFITSPDSVNSILFKSSLRNYSGNMIVAANIQETGGYNSVLHETSMMPNFPGFPLLMTLIFAPNVIFESDMSGGRVINVVAGLGRNSSGNAYFPEHELTVPVDIELTREDIKNINALRHLMSFILYTNEDNFSDLNENGKKDLLHKIKSMIMNILSKNRSRVASSKESGKLLSEIKPEDQFKGRAVYESIPSLELENLNETHQSNLKKQLDDMYQEALHLSQSTAKSVQSKNQSKICPICESIFQTHTAILVHFQSKIHKQTLKMLKLD